MEAHAHRWDFTLRPDGWSAACPCGLAVAVEEQAGGRSLWEWTLRDGVPPVPMMLDGVGSVVRARRAWLRAFAAGDN
jgi:hypothetical protein